ncbi:MAG: hypothetical protein GKR89_17825 [Candidatus Latescibacteria bacterium]|nr:hypothetical protein [Candidatus Latescibacterota bacterium]
MLRRLKTDSPDSAISDEELVEGVQRGDAAAWGAFLERHTDAIYGCAWAYSKSGGARPDNQAQEDEAAELYLFLAETVRHSFKSYRGRCKPRTWVLSVIGNRTHILKAYLLRKDPQRTDMRLPKVMADRPAIEREIYKRLVWGLDPAGIALELDVDRGRCAEVEDLLVQHSPRVYQRVLANRRARLPQVRLDVEEEGRAVQLAAFQSDPAKALEERLNQGLIQDALAAGVEILDAQERRVLVLLYNRGWTAAQIALRALEDPYLGLEGVKDANRVYYLKDRALRQLGLVLLARLAEGGREVGEQEVGRALARSLERLLQERGLPLSRP